MKPKQPNPVQMDDYFGAAATVSNARVVCRTQQRLVNDKLSSDNPVQYFDGWLLWRSSYDMQTLLNKHCWLLSWWWTDCLLVEGNPKN